MLFSKTLTLAIAGAQGILAAPAFTNGTGTVDRSNLTVALVRKPPPNWPLPLTNYDYTGITFNISECVDTGIELIREAKAQGANLIAFPELWFPGFPKGLGSEFNFTQDYLPSYIDNTIVVGDEQWNRLISAIAEAGIYTILNFVEREDDFIYISQSLVDARGKILHHRRKLRPNGNERDIFSDGTLDGLKILETEYGRWGMLACWEHFWPSMTFNMWVQREHVHLAAFPYLTTNDDETASGAWEKDVVNQGVTSTYAIVSGAYTLVPSIGSSFIFDPTGERVAYMSADVSLEEFPMLYYSFDTSRFNSSATYDVNGQTSWAILSQIVDGFPDYVPKVEGEFVKHKNVSVELLQTGEYVMPSS
ncbi:hypothetical protein CkaCkLH20_02059 [Colletotrichum karsti]|uniref:CN hydrolase domain-containing protein n=1 Tax=Colletotrichum karsti TaxID=1095194 RepID=A0A9P6IIK4_9PEZI|nr:uncharacterized protein CkaCkLH20_02059 [Colletotrichum karsti]KAF9880105.1 hypothetical protein CkaCkLH20_02059 [Colletotrichum karsti]